MKTYRWKLLLVLLMGIVELIYLGAACYVLRLLFPAAIVVPFFVLGTISIIGMYWLRSSDVVHYGIIS